MKNSIIIFAIVLQAICINAQSPTLLGAHGSNSPQTLQDLGAQIARYGFTDYKIKNAIIKGNTQALDKARTLNNLNIAQVIYLTWPDTSSINGYERIPTGIDSIEVFLYLNTFLNKIGPYIEYIQISQESFGITSYNPNQQISDVLNWWKTVALFIRNKQILNPVDLGQIKLITGGITGVNGAIKDPNSLSASLIDSVIGFGETYCDAIDIHLHVVDLTMGENIINYIKSKTNHPLTCTEWSQSKVASVVGTNWINAVNTAFKAPHPFAGLTNKRIIEKAYDTPIDSAEWDMLIATSPYTANFIHDFFAVMDSNCFEFACFGGVFQFGSPVFDWDQLIASKTVKQYRYHNNPFYDEFTDLSGIISNGLYNSNCSTSDVIENNFNPENNYSVYPNPFTNSTTIEFNNKINGIYTLKLFNIIGKNVKTISNISTNKILLKRENLTKGVYIFQLSSGNSPVRIAGKLIVE